MRVALLPAGGDPFLLAYWLRNYATWANEVDRLDIQVNGQDDAAVLEYMAQCAAKVPHAQIVQANPYRTDHGRNIGYMIGQANQANEVLLLEDDAFIRRPGVVDERFSRIERGEVDVMGTARDNTDPPLMERCRELWGEPFQGLSGETGYTLYPCHLFARKQDLLTKTDGWFGACGWNSGDMIPGLGIEAFDWVTPDNRPQKTMHADTFSCAGWQLRASGLRVEGEAAYRSDSAHREGSALNAPWFHVGSLQTGVGCLFLVDNNREAIRVITAAPGEIYDWHKRMAWWTRAYDNWDGGIPEYHERYGASLRQAMNDCGASDAEVARWRANYDPLVTWDE